MTRVRSGWGQGTLGLVLSGGGARGAFQVGVYERLLGDAMDGDAQLFARQDAVEVAWGIVQPILGDVTPVHEYEPGTWGPAAADRLTADVGGWHNPA